MPITKKSKCQLRKRLQDYIKDLPEYSRSQIRYCGFRNDEPFKVHLRIHQDQQGNIRRGVYFKGFQTCGSIFCPVCSVLIKTHRAHELNEFCRSWKGKIFFLTFTISHSRTDSLVQLYDVLTNSYRNFWKNDATKSVLGHVDGTVRSFEVTRTTNGWHPHIHTLLFLPESFSFSDDGISKLQQIWSRSVKRAGGEADPEIGLSIQLGDKAGSYICKLGSELQGQECKASCDFQQLLVDRKKSLVQEYLIALKGVRWLRWSKGLRAMLPKPDLTDNQIVAGGMWGFNNQDLNISQLTLNFLEDVFLTNDADGHGRDLLVDLFNNRTCKMFQHGPEFKKAFEAYCNLHLAKNAKLPDPDREQFFRDMLKIGFDPNNFY